VGLSDKQLLTPAAAASSHAQHAQYNDPGAHSPSTHTESALAPPPPAPLSPPQFNYERWLEPQCASDPPSTGAPRFVPFGIGPKACVAQQLAYVQLKVCVVVGGGGGRLGAVSCPRRERGERQGKGRGDIMMVRGGRARGGGGCKHVYACTHLPMFPVVCACDCDVATWVHHTAKQSTLADVNIFISTCLALH